MTIEPQDLLNLLPGVITQIRDALAQLTLAKESLLPAGAREADANLDAQAAILDQSCCRLLWMSNNLNLILSLSQKTPPSLQDVNLVDTVGELCEQAAGLGELMGLRLRFLCSQETILCAVDWNALESILLHLLSNAFRFSPQGGLVTVELSRSGQRVILSVRDAGPGIPRERLDTIFLTDAAASGRSPLQGAGLGLPLCYRLAQRQGATLLAESPPEGPGTRFTLSLPIRTTGTLASPLWDFSGGVNHVLLGLSDVLPAKAFRIRSQS